MSSIKALFIGDVVGAAGCNALAALLPQLKREYAATLVIVNGENSIDSGNGIDAHSAERIYNAGADVITTGNHAFTRKAVMEEYARRETLLRPANFGTDIEGSGVCELDFGSYSAAVINLIGTVYMNPADNPFKYAEELLKNIRSKVIIVDFHAEATSEKRAMGYFLSGRVSAVLGTHTHVQTADEQLINGTAYITDVGMTGANESILGVDKDVIIERFVTYRPVKQFCAAGDADVCGVLVEIDAASGRALHIERVRRTYKKEYGKTKRQ